MFKEQAILGIKWTTFSSISSLILGLIQIGILTRFLSSEDIGILSILTVIIGIANTFSDMGISNSLIHFQDTKQNILDTLYFLNIGSSIILILLLLLLAFPLSSFYKIPQLTEMIQLLSVSMLFLAIGQQFQYLTQKDLDFKPISIINFARYSISFLVTIFLLLNYDLGLYSVIYGIISGAFVYGFSFFFFGIKKYRLPRLKGFNLKESKDHLRFGFFQMGQAFLNYFSSNLDKIIIGKLFGLQILGFYELAYRIIIKPISLINPIFNTVSFPILAKIQDDFKHLNRVYLKKIEGISFLSFPIYFGLFAISSEIVWMLYGPNWDLTAKTLSIIWILGLFWSIGNPMGSYLLALGKPDYSLYLNIYQFIVYSGLLILGSILFNYYGMIVFFVISAILTTLPIDYFIRKSLTNMSVYDHIRATLVNMILSAIMCLTVLGVKQILYKYESNNISVLVISFFLGVAIYSIISILFNKSIFSLAKSILK